MNYINFFGLKVSNFTKEELYNYIEKCFTDSKSYIYYGYSLAVLSYLKKYINYYNVTNKFDLMATDGRIFYILIRLFGFKVQYDISIPRLTFKTIEIANKNRLKVFVLGGTKETNSMACNNIKEKYKNLSAVVGHNGFYKHSEEDIIIQTIKDYKPNLILLGLPTPYKQELALKLRESLNNCIIIPCGGMVNVLAGKEKLTPLFIKKLGLASLFRHLQNPKRLPELFLVGIRALYIFPTCAFYKFILHKNISIPKILGTKI